MKRIQYDRYGGAAEMRLVTFEPPELRDGQIAVQVKAASVNRVDWLIRNGDMKFMTGRRFPRAMGRDFAGVVTAVGNGVSRVKFGDTVFGAADLRRSGAFANMLVTDEKRVALKPPTLSFTDAACLPTVGSIAWNGLIDQARLKPGQLVFVNGCCGSVGRMCVQIAKLHGAQVTGTCSRASMEDARSLGVEPVIDYAAADLASRCGRFDVVYDTAGTLPVAQALALLKPKGVFLDINPTLGKFVRGLLSRRYKFVILKPSPDVLEKLAKAALEGEWASLVSKTAPLEDAVAEISNLETTGQPKGKLVILINS